METQLIINVESELTEVVKVILDDIGLDISTTIKIFFKRVAKERSVSFLLSSNTSTGINEDLLMENKVITSHQVFDNHYQTEKYDITKSRAIALLKNEGINFNRNITFASKNRGAHNYWANPGFEMLENDWFLILNDWKKRELHLFLIPANSIDASELTPRNDKNLIDLQIMYDDSTFHDNRSGMSFAKYLIKQLKY